jgi:REP element-mobilizing transposase RayT
MAQQSSFFTHPAFRPYSRKEHGGSLARGRRKEYRPFDPRRPLHVTLRSERARGHWSFLDPKNERRVRHLVERFAAKNRVRIFKFANSGNHLHLVVHAKDPKAFQRFLKTIAGQIACAVTGARKGAAVRKTDADPSTRKFWDALAWSRIIEWGRDLRGALDYLTMNEMEAAQVWRREWSRPRAKRRP